MVEKKKAKIAKRSAGLVIAPPAPRPASPDDPSLKLFREAKEAQERQNATPPLPPPTTSYPQPPPPGVEASPKRDFSKVANSITRDALPAGLFKGTSKKLYDALYQRTRGAITPVREIKARQSDLMAWAGVSHNTLRAHLRHLEGAGLVITKWELGDNYGAVYEIIIPEELDPSYHLPPPTPTTTQKLGGPSTQKLVGGGGGQVADFSITYGNPKTLIKTNTEIDDDDAALAGLFSVLKELSQEVTGKGLSPAERERWNELGEVLRTETKIAGARTTISSLPAFLAEHLRRRLWKKDKKQIEAERAAPSTEQANTSTLTPEEVKSCPDCSGTYFYYPMGYDQPVERCRHEKLLAAAKEKQDE